MPSKVVVLVEIRVQPAVECFGNRQQPEAIRLSLEHKIQLSHPEQIPINLRQAGAILQPEWDRGSEAWLVLALATLAVPPLHVPNLASLAIMVRVVPALLDSFQTCGTGKQIRGYSLDSPERASSSSRREFRAASFHGCPSFERRIHSHSIYVEYVGESHPVVSSGISSVEVQVEYPAQDLEVDRSWVVEV